MKKSQIYKLNKSFENFLARLPEIIKDSDDEIGRQNEIIELIEGKNFKTLFGDGLKNNYDIKLLILLNYPRHCNKRSQM